MLLFVKREHKTQKNHDELYWNKSLWKKIWEKLEKILPLLVKDQDGPIWIVSTWNLHPVSCTTCKIVKYFVM